MKKKLLLSSLMLTSLIADADMQPSCATPTVRFSFNFNNRQDIRDALEVLKKLIPQVYACEVGNDVQKKVLIDSFAEFTKQVIAETFIKGSTEEFDEIMQTTNTSLTEYQSGTLTTREAILALAEKGQRAEEVRVFTKLNAFLHSADGQILLEKLEVCHANGLKNTANFVVFFNILREVAAGLDKNEPAPTIVL